MAWACFALGRDDEALDASLQALADAPEAKREVMGALFDEFQQAIARASSVAGLAQAAREIEELEARRAELLSGVLERDDLVFPDEEVETRWWNDQFAELVSGLEQLESEPLAADAVSPEHGWSVPKQLAYARELRAGFAPGGAHALAWERDLPALRAAAPGRAGELFEAVDLLGHLGLTLPSEAQWEYGCRGGTDTPWWTVRARESMRGTLNVADQVAARSGATWGEIADWPDLDDAWGAYAPVNEFVANPSGSSTCTATPGSGAWMATRATTTGGCPRWTSSFRARTGRRALHAAAATGSGPGARTRPRG